MACRPTAPLDRSDPDSRTERSSPTEQAQAATAALRADDSALPWGTRVKWYAWDDGLAKAKASRKPLCVVVYADWCARCKELAPVFSRRDVADVARGLIMVRQDQDEKPEWLDRRLGQYGHYVPRIFFFDTEGNVREDLHSGHPRYPYFYAASVTDRLKANMRNVLGG